MVKTATFSEIFQKKFQPEVFTVLGDAVFAEIIFGNFRKSPVDKGLRLGIIGAYEKGKINALFK